MFIAYGADILCQIDQVGNSDFFRFDGTAGEKIKIEALGTAYPCIELVGVSTACYGGYQQEWIERYCPQQRSTRYEFSINTSAPGPSHCFWSGLFLILLKLDRPHIQ